MADTPPSSNPQVPAKSRPTSNSAGARPAAAGPAAPADSTITDQNVPKVRWDDSKMRTAYANVCNVASTREEVTLLFGVNQGWQQNQKEFAVELTDRILMSPFAAKRLASLLATVIKEYESRFGVLDTSLQKTYDVTPKAPTPGR